MLYLVIELLSKASVFFESKSLGGNQSFSLEVTKYHKQLIQCTVRNTKNHSCPTFILNCNFWLAFRKLIIRPSLSNLTILSIPRNRTCCSEAENKNVANSSGKDATTSTQNLPFSIYLIAIFLLLFTSFPVLELT